MMSKGKPAFEEYRDAEINQLRERVKELRNWVNDLHAGMYINCVYCGHRYGPDAEVPASMADVLKKHIEQCPKHPMSALKKAAREAKLELIIAVGPHAQEEGLLWPSIQRALDGLTDALGKSEETRKENTAPTDHTSPRVPGLASKLDDGH